MKQLLTTFILLTGISANAQQETFFNQFWNNQTHYNPAFAGLEHQMQAGALYRNQWSGVNGAPEDIYAYGNMRLKDNWGIGLQAQYGTIGFNTEFQTFVPASYRLQLNDKNTLAFGAALGFNHLSTYGTFIPPETENDPVLPSQGSIQFLTGQAGVVFKNRKIACGISARSVELADLSGNNGYDRVPHYYAMMQYKMHLGKLTAQPLVVFLEANYGTVVVQQILQTNVRVMYKNQFTIFGGYDWSNGIIAGGGYDILEKFRLNYSITFVRNALQSVTNYTHEFAFVYMLQTKE
ncbi:MAG: PorP/SprF family type IX secretion system membrane protein [bacterium]|nr:PorP/SprF family type IX secretion system membrane protein [bacterium]